MGRILPIKRHNMSASMTVSLICRANMRRIWIWRIRLILYAAESDVVGIVLSATEPYSLYPPNITPLGNRDEVGIVTKIDHWAANPQQAAEWLKLTGCKKIFFTSAYTGEGIEEIFEFLREEHDICPVEKVMDALHKESFGKQAELPHYHLQ